LVQNVTATSLGGCTTVSWLPPSYAGPPATVLSYFVISTNGQLRANVSQSPAVFCGLMVNQVWTFDVYASNALGTGFASKAHEHDCSQNPLQFCVESDSQHHDHGIAAVGAAQHLGARVLAGQHHQLRARQLPAASERRRRPDSALHRRERARAQSNDLRQLALRALRKLYRASPCISGLFQSSCERRWRAYSLLCADEQPAWRDAAKSVLRCHCLLTRLCNSQPRRARSNSARPRCSCSPACTMSALESSCAVC